jgi:hypothetical protein
VTKVACDPRADDGRRLILLGRRTITIKRRLRGVKMHLTVPVETYQGVIMAREGRSDGVLYRVTLAHRDPDLSVTLKESRSRGAMIEAWHHWSTFFAAPTDLERMVLEPILEASRPGHAARMAWLRRVQAGSAGGRRVILGQTPHRRLRVATVKRGGRKVTPRP